MAAIALRAALVSITTLPKSNIFILDEPFISLDQDYVDATNKILNYLKELFDIVIIITHLSEFKDICDNVISIERGEDGYSRILQ